MSNNYRMSKIIAPAYYRAWRSDKQNMAIGGSKGSGKSFFVSAYVIYHMMKNPHLNVLVVRKVYETIKDSCYTDLLKAINLLDSDDDWKRTQNPLEIRYKTGQKILFRGLDNPYKLASITVEKGYLAWVWFEEAFDITNYQDILKVQGSIRAIPPETGLTKKFIYTFNPWGPDHWLKHEYYDKKRNDTLSMITTYLDNPGITEEDRQWYENLKILNPRAAEVICYGHWGRAEGLIYENWLEKDFDYTEILQRPGTKAIYGLDFGYKTSYNAFIAAVADVQKHEMYVFDEIYSKGMTNLDIAKVITQAGYAGERIIADSAEPKSIDELRTGRGLVEEVIDQATGEVRYDKYRLPNIQPAVKGPDSVRNGIARLQEFTIYIHPKCKNFKSEIQLYAYKVDKNGKLTGEPEKEFDHACLVGDTMILTTEGEIPIRDIEPGMEVITWVGPRQVVDWMMTCPDAEIYRLELYDGSILEGTRDHGIFLAGVDEPKEIGGLIPDYDNVIIRVDGKTHTSRVRSIIDTGRREKVYNITVEDVHQYFANGVSVRNCDALRYCTSALFQMGHTKVVEAKGALPIEQEEVIDESVLKPVKRGHSRVVSTHSDPNEDWRSYFGFGYYKQL